MLENETKKLLDAIKQFSKTVYKETEIFIVNPFDLIEIDMSKIPSNCFFISYLNTEKGYFYKIKDEELKRSLCKFIENIHTGHLEVKNVDLTNLEYAIKILFKMYWETSLER